MTNNEMRLPEITGVSDKQISYAKSLRDRYVSKRSDNIETAKDMLDSIDHEQVKKMAIEEGKTEDEVTAEACKAYGLYESYIVLTTTNASKIIDTLK